MVNIRFRPLALLVVAIVASLALLFVVAPQTAESSTADRGAHGQSQSQSQGPKIDSQDVLVLLDRDPLEAGADTAETAAGLRSMRSSLTVIAGRVVHSLI